MKWPLAAVLVGTARSPATGFHVNPIPVRSTTTVAAAAAGVEQSSRITAYRYSRPSRHRVASARASAAAGLGGAADGVESSLQHLTQPGEEDEDEDEGAFFSAEESLPPTTPPAPARAAPAQPAATEDDNTNAVISTVVSDEDNKAPIDWVLSRRLPQHSRRFYRKALEAGDVKVDGRKVKRFIRVKRGARISVDLGRQQQQQGASAVAAATTTPPPNLVFPQRLPRLRVVYEDDHLFVVMKPAGMICQPCAAAPRGTVLHGLMYHMVQSGQLEEGSDTTAAAANTLSQGIVQRLDKQTSGIMVVAKTLAASSKLSALFRKGKVKKQYLAVCHGDPGFDSVVDAPLYRRSSGKVGAVEPWEAEEFRAKVAQTRVRNVATARGLSLCRADILTGRMHQVRVHLKVWIL
ncbi:unnamed protein product [Ectocarpus sp. 8 AP-2014]